MKKINRRDFIRNGSLVALGTGLAVNTSLARNILPGRKSKVIQMYSPDVVTGDREINKELVAKMLHNGLVEVSGKKKTPLSKYVKPGEKIGLKVNCLGRAMLSTHQEVIDAMVEELKDAGIAENDIIVWDRFLPHMTSCNMTINHSDKGVRYLASEDPANMLSLNDEDLIYESDVDNPDRRSHFGTSTYMSKIFTQECDKIINMAILKDHGLAGVTLCLKNISYGICNNNARFHNPEHIGPFITDIYALPEVQKKVVLNVLDGIEGCFEQGPMPRSKDVLFTPGKIWVSEDPVAIDKIGLDLIEAERMKNDLEAVADIRPGTNHIELAGEAGLGIADPDRINIIEKTII